MKKNLPQTSLPEFQHIDISRPRGAATWAAKFGCTQAELKRAVKKVGSTAGAVRAELGKRVPLADPP